MDKFLKRNFVSISLLLISIIVFSQFIFYGDFFIGSTDAYTIKVPKLFDGWDFFKNLHINLWDTNTNSGSPAVFSSTFPNINVDNFFLFLAGFDNFGYTFSLLAIFKFIIFSIYLYKFLNLEVSSKHAVLVTFFIALLSGRVIWSLTTYENFNGLLYSLLILYVFRTQNRNRLKAVFFN